MGEVARQVLFAAGGKDARAHPRGTFWALLSVRPSWPLTRKRARCRTFRAATTSEPSAHAHTRVVPESAPEDESAAEGAVAANHPLAHACGGESPARPRPPARARGPGNPPPSPPSGKIY